MLFYKKCIILWLIFPTICLGNSYNTYSGDIPMDTSKQIILIPLKYTCQNLLLTYCGHSLTQSICSLNDIYQNHGVLFCLTSPEENKALFSVESVFYFDTLNHHCEVYYDIEKVESLIRHYTTRFSPTTINMPSSLQMKIKKPQENSVVHYKDIDIVWNPAGEADQYLVELSLDKDFKQILYSNVAFASSCRIPEVPKNNLIYYRIKPLQFIWYCEEFRAAGSFYASDVFIKPVSLLGVSVYSLAPPNENNIFVNNPENKYYELQIEDLLGKIYCKVETNSSRKMIDVGNFGPGAYFFQIRIQDKLNYSTLIVH